MSRHWLEGFTPLKQPENGIGWTPDRFRLKLWYPNGQYIDPQVMTWEQAIEKARRSIEAAGDPVLSVTLETADPLP